MYPLRIIKKKPSVNLNWVLLKKFTIPPVFEGLGAFTGLVVVFFAIRVDNSCAKLTIFDCQIFYLFNSTLTLLKNQPFYPESLKGKVDFSAFSLKGRGEKAEKSFLVRNLLK
jgi:hypothetical protein